MLALLAVLVLNYTDDQAPDYDIADLQSGNLNAPHADTVENPSSVRLNKSPLELINRLAFSLLRMRGRRCRGVEYGRNSRNS